MRFENRNHQFQPVLKLAVVYTGLLPALALGQVDTSEWVCEFCPFPDGYEADVDVGASYVSDDAYRFGNATGYDEKGPYVILDGSGSYNRDGYELNWYAEDLGLASRVFEIDGGRQGSFGFYVGYSELPYRLFDSTSTVFSPANRDVLELPSDWVAASQTSGFTALSGSLRPVRIGTDRKTLKAGADYEGFRNLTVFVDYRHQQRDGVQITSGANFVQAALLPRLIDQRTDTVDLGVNYAQGPLSVTLAWYGSFFSNLPLSLTWDNPFTPAPGADQGRLAQEPDNKFQQLSLSATYSADTLRSVFGFTAAFGSGEQNDDLLAYTINPILGPGSLPRATLDGTVDTTNLALTVTSRPFDKARVRFAYRYDERDNSTTQDTWSRVIVDAFQSEDPELNTPYSFERNRLSLGGDYRLFEKLRVSAGYDRTQLDRDYQEVAEQTEDSGWGKVAYAATDWLDLTAKGGASRREVDRYDTDVAESFGQNPLLRKYNLAHRFRQFGELTMSITPAEKPFSIGLTALYADDDYSKSRLGLANSRNIHVSADLNYSISETASVYLLGGVEYIDADQFGSATFSTPTWQAVHEDDFDHYGAGLQLTKLGEKADLSVDYIYTKGQTSINMREGGTDNPFPTLDSKLHSLRVSLGYQHSEKLALDVSLRFESFETSDWALDGVEPDTISTVLTLGADSYDYSVWVAGLSFRYLIGATKPQ